MNKVNSQHTPLNHHNKDFSPPPLLSLSISDSPIKEQFVMKVDQNQHAPVNTQDFSSLFGQFSLKTVPSSPYENQKIFSCIECGQTFNRAHNLKSHKATHSATKPFQCHECDKQFLRLHDLKRHQKLHTGERPHHCPNCKRSFSRLDALNRHRKTEGGSACLRTVSKTTTTTSTTASTTTVPMPTMTTQWQVNSKSISPFVSTRPILSPPLQQQQQQQQASSPPPPPPPLPPPALQPSLPPFIIPFSNSTTDQDEIDVLKQRIHDLEVENRVLRSLLRNKDDDDDNNNNDMQPKRQRSP